MAYLLAALGGALGALARWGLAEAIPHSPTGLPWATLAVNLTGCLVLGVLTAVLVARAPFSPWARPFLGVGVLGGFTTYSTFAVEVVQLADAGAAGTAAGYVLVSVLGGIAAAAVGTVAGRALAGSPR
ncbi:fluoride efflux transporter CrcB [Blastococcus sp. KM273128]|uniref:fluoride efflux transporter CrcB n=1 Tax=Blastococcus sp. KM273128 TaxID=2570314 RepID=UPI001F000EEE|nr:fluoride efflux transporter CrcB [Blastococcus sp. KM273128]MCF6743360.1 fluoride efflux transporter CrcB [Blastococcus sp. KM273128]